MIVGKACSKYETICANFFVKYFYSIVRLNVKANKVFNENIMDKYNILNRSPFDVVVDTLKIIVEYNGEYHYTISATNTKNYISKRAIQLAKKKNMRRKRVASHYSTCDL